MEKKSYSNNIDYIQYSNQEPNYINQPKNRNTITSAQPKNSKNYFHLYKEKEINPNNINKKNCLNEIIYENNSKKLGEYYSKNKEDIVLYGSSKYDLLPVESLVQEMKQYKNSIIEKIKQNPNKYKLKNFGIKNSNVNMILTPLAEKERSSMGNNEKELFNLAERRGVVMRRIEYSNSLMENGDCDNEIFLLLKHAVNLIEKCWLFYKGLKKRKFIKGFILINKYIKRKILRLLNSINNEKLKFIYMNSNCSSISFKNLNVKNSGDIDTNNKKDLLLSKKLFNKLNICPIDRINIFGSVIKDDKKSMDDLQKKYYKLILDYKMMKEELNKYKKENSQMNEKINILENENKEIIILKNEKDELIKKFDEMNTNYNTLLKDFDALNANNSNLLNNQSIIFNSFKNNNIPINETEEYISLLNKYNSLNDNYNKLLEEINEMKIKNKELNELLLKNNEVKNSYIPIDEETINEINEYKNKIEELNNQILKQENEYEQQIKNLNENINSLIKEKEDLNKNLNEIQFKIKENQKNGDNSDNKNYINKIQLLENHIKNYETQISQLDNKIKENENLMKNKEKELVDFKNKIIKNEKEILEYKNKEIDLKNKINDYEQKININISQNKINNEIVNENKNLKTEINEYKTNIVKYKRDIDNTNKKLNEFQKKLNSYLSSNHKLKEENNKSKITIGKLNNLIIGLNNRIKQLLEENKNIRDNIKDNYFYNRFNLDKIFILFIDKLFNKKVLEYKYQLMINLFQENINNFTKYIIFQNNSVSSINLDGYEKVITGESKKIITKEDEQNRISYDNKVIIHKELDDTLKDYIIKGKDNLTFDEIFEEVKTNNNFLNGNDNKN